MNDAPWTAVDGYVTELLVRPDSALDAAMEASVEAGLPAIAVTPPQGKLLQILARGQGARNVLEIGTLGGFSTIWLARGLADGGRITTLEIDPRHAEIATANIARAGFADVVQVRLGPAIDTLARIAEEDGGPFDLIFIDADKASTPEYFDRAVKLSRAGTLILVDNVVRNGGLADGASEDPSIRGVRRLHEQVGSDPRVSATTIQTVGSKGYDGFLIAVVESVG
jgi:predicted O-methyltransferase YrrM